MMDKELLFGRMITCPKIQETDLEYQRTASFIKGVCQRCGQNQKASLPRKQFYCQACLILGRVSSLDDLISLPEPNNFDGQVELIWPGTLTQQQAQVSKDLVSSMEQGRNHLVWAVTGAGKTEMLFPLLLKAFQQKKRVALVSPRVDVIAELAPRLAAAFANLSQVVLHGKQTTPYGYTQLVLATTHQLLRFKSAFDVLIIDEVDSFPFRGNPMLQYAVQTARKKISTIVYLTATPTPALKTAVKRGNLKVSYLPLRFHQQLLPKLQIKRVNNWRLKMPKLLKKQIEIFIEEQRQFLIFVPYVSDLIIVERYLQAYTQLKGTTVHANDPDRIEKVQQMRQENIHFLITTTILERGVTLPGIDVLILGADENTFSENALVQIAGRVGRSYDRPTGLVLAFVRQINLAVFRAQKQINTMNQRGCQLKKKLEVNDELSPVSAKN